MRALLQRVTGASVEADRQVIGSIDRGLVTLLGVAAGDGPDPWEGWFAGACSNSRAF